ncbi:MAG: VWA domain-containing protein [Acidobacteriaceae bacterium]
MKQSSNFEQLLTVLYRQNKVSAQLDAPGEPMLSLRPAILLVCFSLAIVHFSHAQTQSGTGTTRSQPAYTIQTGARVVLTDVTVTDESGNPVRGLPVSAFHVFDNKKQERVDSFEEHAGTSAVALPASPYGVFSNDYLLHLPPVLNIIVLDIANIGIVDQMWLNYQLTGLLTNLPSDQPVAIYLRAGSGCFLVQNFTTDRGLLLAALHRAIPRIPPLGPEYLSDQQILTEVAYTLRSLPGRKNVLWFSGGSTAYLLPKATPFQDQVAIRAIYDSLEEERIAVYPIDARGLTIASGVTMIEQHGAMEEVARATGGRAFYDNNGISQAAAHLLDTSGDFYTLTYSPSNFKVDNKWHNVRIKLDGGYHVSYRTGYFADGSNGIAQNPAQPRTKLLISGDKAQTKREHATPIIFQAAMLPTADPVLAPLRADAEGLPAPPLKGGAARYSVRYSVPIDELTGQSTQGKHTFVIGLAAVTIDRDGDILKRQFEHVTVSFDEDYFSHRSRAPLVVDQQLNLNRADQYLYLAVWDIHNDRFGELQMPLNLPAPKRH